MMSSLNDQAAQSLPVFATTAPLDDVRSSNPSKCSWPGTMS